MVSGRDASTTELTLSEEAELYNSDNSTPFSIIANYLPVAVTVHIATFTLSAAKCVCCLIVRFPFARSIAS